MRAMEIDDDYDDEEEDDDEIKGFLLNTSRSQRSDFGIRNGESDPTTGHPSRTAPLRLCGIASTVLSFIAVLYLLESWHASSVTTAAAAKKETATRSDGVMGPSWIEPNHDTNSLPTKRSTNVTNFNPATTTTPPPPPESTLLYTCPKVSSIAENVATAATEHKAWYETTSQSIAANNVSTYMRSFRNMDYDNWGHSYTEVKHGMAHWKSKKFSDLQSGDMIYESACGIGMNLFMTLEIMHKVKQVTNVTVFGNEYIPHSADIARTIATNGLLPANGHLGTICSADSTNLTFVPSNTFDLVFTGYISPLFDPLRLELGSTDANFAQYAADCEGDKRRGNNVHSAAADAAQQRQNDWYAMWVGEMIRIAKPGAPVIIEQVSYPLCVAPFDWGGVAQDFWKKSIRRYNWDIDPTSIEMEDDVLFKKRYHVFLRKNGKRR